MFLHWRQSSTSTYAYGIWSLARSGAELSMLLVTTWDHYVRATTTLLCAPSNAIARNKTTEAARRIEKSTKYKTVEEDLVTWSSTLSTFLSCDFFVETYSQNIHDPIPSCDLTKKGSHRGQRKPNICQYINAMLPATDIIEFRIDNQALLKRLQGNETNTKLEFECRYELNKLGGAKHVNIRWVKSHNRISGNEAADMLAKDGANQRCNKIVMIDHPRAYIKEQLWEATKKEWSKEWKFSKHTKFKMEDSKYWLPDIRLDLGRNLQKMERAEASKIIGIITGHCPIGKHLARAKLLDEDINPKVCRLCMKEVEENDMESIKHWIEDCNSTIHARFRSFGTMLPDKIKRRWTINKMLKFCSSNGIKDIFTQKEKHEDQESDEE